jgi:hypothetical protein
MSRRGDAVQFKRCMGCPWFHGGGAKDFSCVLLPGALEKVVTVCKRRHMAKPVDLERVMRQLSEGN